MSRPKYHAVLDDIYSSESISGPEFLVRLFLVISTATVGWLALDLEILLLWVPAYYALVAVEKLILLQRKSWPSARVYTCLILLGMITATVFSTLPVYLWYMEGDIWKMGSLVLMTGGVLNIFLIRSRNWQISVAYVVPVSIAFYAIAWDFFTWPQSNVVFWCALVLAVAMNIYLFAAIWEVQKSNEKLREAREQFHQAQKIEALGTLTGGIAHDFNNLLSVTKGNLELLQAYPDSPDASEFLKEAIASSDRGAELTRQLLAYVRRSELKFSVANPAEVLKNVGKMASRLFKPNIRIVVDAGDAATRVLVDISILEAALLNLCVNARDAMPSGGKLVLRARTEILSKQGRGNLSRGHYLRLDVADTGAGIEKRHLDQVFDPFFTTKDVGKGTGLGLAMVKGFAQQSGGDAIVESIEGQGTTVSIYLPKS